MERDHQEEVELTVYPYQVSGKAPKLYSHHNSRILKGLDPREEKFYLATKNPNSPPTLQKLGHCLPTYFGRVQLQRTPKLIIQQQQDWLQHLASRYQERISNNEFIELQNLTEGMEQPSVFDIKIGGRNVEGKTHKINKSVAQHSIKLNGCRLAFPKPVLLTKYFLSTITQFQAMTKYLALFLSNSTAIQLPVLHRIINQLQHLYSLFQQVRGYRFISSSICMIYDLQHPDHVEVRLIDFGRVVEEEQDFSDSESEAGIRNILAMLRAIQQSPELFEAQLSQLLRKCYQEEVSVIPEHKRVGFQPQLAP